MRTPSLLPALVIVLTLALGVAAQADPVVQLVGPVGQDGLNLWTYNYVIDNTLGDLDIWDLWLLTGADDADIADWPAHWDTTRFPETGGQTWR